MNNSEYNKNDMWDCYDYVLDAVKKSGLNLQFASDKLKNDKTILINALNNNNDIHEDLCEIFNFASNKLKNNKEIILYIAEKSYNFYHDCRIFNYLSDEMKYDYDLIYQYCLICFDIPKHIFTNEFINILDTLKDDLLVNIIDPDTYNEKIININDYNISNYFEVINDDTFIYNDININNIFIPKFKKIEILLNDIVKTILSNRIIKSKYNIFEKDKENIIKHNIIILIFNIKQELINNFEQENNKIKNNIFNIELKNNIYEQDLINFKQKNYKLEIKLINIKKKIFNILNQQFKKINNNYKQEFIDIKKENNEFNTKILNIINQEFINIKQGLNNILNQELINIREINSDFEQELIEIKQENIKFRDYLIKIEQKFINIKKDNINKNLIIFIILLYNLLILYLYIIIIK
jgi:hypothetical protein